jgi:3-hydroxy-3-methylglutaryl CoA synthase/uncharacterized OB-fold protein
MAPSLKAFAHGHRAIASWDEDSITMAVEAARPLMRALSDCTWQGLTLASTTLPFAERLQAGIAASALGLPRSLMARDVASSLRAASTELLALLRQGGGGAHLLLAADRRIACPASAQEMQFGDGAAAAALGWGHPIAELVGAHSVRADFVHRFRPSGQDHDYGWEERWLRDEGFMKIVVPAIQECLQVAGVQPAEIAQFAMPALLSRIGEAVARKLGLSAAALVDDPAARCGDAGTAQPLALLDVALRRAAADELVLLAVFGSGCDVLLLRRTGVPCPGMPPDDGKPETNYLKYLSFTGQIELDWGMRAEMDNKTALTAAWRDEAHNAHFEAGECTRCGTVQFPPSRMCVNPACRAQDTQRPHSLADTGARVLSHTSDWLGYTPAPPFQFGHIDFDGGGRVLMEFADTDPDELRVGLPLRMVFRVKEFDPRRGYRRYFWKATPLRAAEQRGAAGG